MGELTVALRRRDPDGRERVTDEVVDPAHVGIVVIDMWNWHWCKTSAARVACMVPRMNRCLDGARALGMQVFLCPTDVANCYVGTPQRERALAVERLPLPESLNLPCPPPEPGGCMCGARHCVQNYGWDGMAPDLAIRDGDLIARGEEELYSLCHASGITHLWFGGVHTNNCVLGKPVGMRNMMNYGLTCALVRDLQDPETFYDPEKGITPDANNARVVAHFERYLAPSLDLKETLRANGRWGEDGVVDPVRITPWGRPNRPHFFEDQVVVTLTLPLEEGATLRFTLDGRPPTRDSELYRAPLVLKDTTTLKAAGFDGGRRVGLESTGHFVRVPPRPPSPHVPVDEIEPLSMKGGHGTRTPRLNESCRGTPLRVRGETYGRGVGMEAPAHMALPLRPGDRRFVALCGIDDYLLEGERHRETARYPSVVFKVFIDGAPVAQSPVMRQSEGPWPFDVPIPPGSRLINLVATPTGDGNRHDYADWVEAGFV
jgi:hypothetical protein